MSAPRTMTIEEARISFNEVVKRVRNGEEVEITDQGAVVMRVVPAEPVLVPRRVFGVDRGRIRIAEDFGAPLEDMRDLMP